MIIKELKEDELESMEEEMDCGDFSSDTILASETKRVLVGAGARALFYPTLLYNVVRNKIQPEFRWWDKVDEFVLLGAVPFPTDVPRLKSLGVRGVVTLNEPYETLVTTSLYHEHKINHLVIPTRDYLFAPSYDDICEAVDFIHGNASCGKTTYVHCKAGRGRSTTIVLCYLIKHKHMTPKAAYEHVRSIRPRVLLASSQWQAVEKYYYYHVKKSLVMKEMDPKSYEDNSCFDDCSMVLVSESDLEGYNENEESGAAMDKNLLAELNRACRFQFASQAAIATRISWLWFRCQTNRKVSMEKLEDSMSNAQLGNLGVDIHVY